MCTKNDETIECFACGACCVAFSISTFEKESGKACAYLSENGLCGIYSKRPDVCREFVPDEVCVLIQGLPFGEKVEILKKIYGM
ncbi:MAG: YkgJ family cysteine cluster protein [Flexistipes sinusarabici]|uniref:YkgJ family cysteine cluster protein n=1 Tax=Flexistipes sinusarabici TaxID=2352 RepID=A0A5D0MRJ7_FLESI|nr:YkgJ family cysteine cluster protein [Flexistipes sinusarabici]TYB34178.1 MAG: YkgJ family cysteine cluster protein [Flexistipes sinusarabici]